MANSEMEVLESIVQGLQQKRLKRKEDEWTEKFNIIQGRIEATLEGYKVDTELLEKQLIKKCSAIKFADNLEELSKLITDASSRADHSQKTQVFIVGYQNKSTQRLQMLNDVVENLHMASLDDDDPSMSTDSGLGEFDNIDLTIDETIGGVSEAIHKLDDLSDDIVKILEANRTGAGAKKRRVLERKVNALKTELNDSKKKLEDMKGEIAAEQGKNFQFLAKVKMRDQDIQKLEKEKDELLEKAEEATAEMRQAKTDKMDVIFMYEERIKELNRKIPGSRERADKEIATDPVLISEVVEVDGENLEVPQAIPSRVQSANVLLEKSSFEIMHIEPRRTLSADEKHTKSLILKEDDLGPTPTTLSRPTTATQSIQTDEMIMPDPVESVIVHPPKPKQKKAKGSVSSTKDDEKPKSSKTAKKSVKMQNSTKPAKPTVASSSKTTKPFAKSSPNIQSTELEQQKQSVNSQEKKEIQATPKAEVLESAGRLYSATQKTTDRAFIRCFNKLLWFSAEIEEVLGIRKSAKIIQERNDFESLQENERVAEAHRILARTEDIVENLTAAIKAHSIVNEQFGISEAEAMTDLEEKYDNLMVKYRQSLEELKKIKRKELLRKTKSESHVQLQNAVLQRSQSSAGLNKFFATFDARQRKDSLKESGVLSDSASSINRKKISIDLEDKTQKAPPRVSYVSSSSGIVTKPRSDRFDTMTQSLISIEDTVQAPAELLEDFERFTDDLVDGVIANKQISQIAIPFIEPQKVEGSKEGREEDHDDDNSVFETNHADPPNSRASVRTEVIETDHIRSAQYTNSKIQKFANEWSRAISTSEYAHDIRTNLTKMEKLEIRRNRIWTTMTEEIYRLRHAIRYQIRKATKDLRIRTIRKFQPDLLNLFISGEKFKNQPESSKAPTHSRAGHLLRGRLTELSSGFQVDSFDDFQLTGSSCLLSSQRDFEASQNAYSAPKLPKLQPPSAISSRPSSGDSSRSRPTQSFLQMDLSRRTIPHKPI